MRLTGSISFKIWAYCSSILFIAIGIVIYYFPNEQKKSIIKYRGKELQELTRTIALGVELSLEENDFQKLKKSLDHYRNKRNEFDFLILTHYDSVSQKESVFNTISDNLGFDFSRCDTTKYLIQYTNYHTNAMVGKVLIGLSKNRINREVQQNNVPIYLTLLVILLFTVLLSYVVAKKISSPIKNAIANALLLKDEAYEGFNLMRTPEENEIAQLYNALCSLKDSLLKQRNENIRLVNNLEQTIKNRTANLNQTLYKLQEAQNIAMLGYFSYYPGDKNFTLSENLYEILALTGGTNISLVDFLKTIDDDYTKELNDSLHAASTTSFSIQVKCKQGDTEGNLVRWIAITGKPMQDEFGKQIISGTIQEITASKHAEAALRRLSQALKNSSNSVIVTDLQQKIIWINDTLPKLTGYTREEIIGNTPKMFQFEGTDEEVKKAIRKSLQEFKPHKTEICNISKSGHVYWLELYIQPIYNEKGIPEGFMAIEIDITDRKEKERLIEQYIAEIELKQREIETINLSLEEKVAQKTIDLELSIKQIKQSQEEIIKKEKMAALGVLIAGIAHEVNTPLGAIKASADNLEYLFNQEFIKTIHEISLKDLNFALELFSIIKGLPAPSTVIQRERTNNIINHLKTYHINMADPRAVSSDLAYMGFEGIQEPLKSILESSDGLQIVKTTRLFSNIERSLKTINEGAIKSSKIIKALNMYAHATEEVMTVFNLKTNIDNIITLLWNKIKYHATLINNIPSEIMISGFEDELAQVWTNIINNALQASLNKCTITIDYELNNGLHKITISNNGPKIPDEIKNRIFEEFFTTKKRGEGTGLGLNIVKRIVQKHGGEIICNSDESITSFITTIPVDSKWNAPLKTD